MKYLQFDIRVNTWVTREGDPDDRWDRDSTDGDVTILSCRIVPKDHYETLIADWDAKTGETVWLVWAQYSTGDSFGRDGGRYELCSVHKTAEDAGKEEARLREVKDYSVPWNGYFEHLDFIKSEPFVILP